jgi:hypothetical protein
VLLEVWTDNLLFSVIIFVNSVSSSFASRIHSYIIPTLYRFLPALDACIRHQKTNVVCSL